MKFVSFPVTRSFLCMLFKVKIFFYCITYIFLAVTNGVLALVTTTGNVLVLTAV